jgi:hypothetical protein
MSPTDVQHDDGIGDLFGGRIHGEAVAVCDGIPERPLQIDSFPLPSCGLTSHAAEPAFAEI